MQQAIASFLNERKWSSDNFEDFEKIECSFFINILEAKSNNQYNASLTVIANRPIYNTSYTSTLINRFDKDLTFTYKQFDPLDFNENQFINNLTHTLAFYAYFILGMDYDSYAQNGREVYFQKAQELVNNVPSTSGFSGWRSFDNNNQNRYWLVNNVLNSRYTSFREGNYTYHRLGLDRLVDSGHGNVIAAKWDVELFKSWARCAKLTYYAIAVRYEEIRVVESLFRREK